MPYNFTDDDKVKSSWWQKNAVGDSIQGTLVGKREQLNRASGKMQWVYEILTEEDEIWLVGGNYGIDLQMRHVKLGQIVEFRYIEERKATVPGHDPTKVVQVFAKTDLVNEKWLQEQETAAMQEETAEATPSAQVEEDDGEIKVEGIPFNDPEPKTPAGKAPVATPEAPTVSPIVAQKTEIDELAKTKLKVTNPDDVQKVVMEQTGLAFIDANLGKIITKLKEM